MVVFALAAMLGVTIGASGAGAAMAAADASRALPRGYLLLLFVPCVLTGALLGAPRVIITLSTVLIPAGAFTYPTVLAVTGAAALALLVANVFRVPQSTTHVTVAAIAGVGIAHGNLDIATLGRIAMAWAINPLLALSLCYLIGRWLGPTLAARTGSAGARVVVIGASCFMAVGIGMNNVSNAVAAVVGGGYLDVTAGALAGGLLLALGGLFLGRRTVSTIGKEITRLSMAKGAVVCLVTAGLTISASRLGLPTSYVQTSTLAVLGIGAAQTPLLELLRLRVLRRIGFLWLASPTVAFLTGFWLLRGTP